MARAAQQKTDRREFFRSAARYAVLGVLTAGGIVAARRSTSQTCLNQGICNACGEFASCGLPAALSAKKTWSLSRQSQPKLSVWQALREARRADRRKGKVA